LKEAKETVESAPTWIKKELVYTRVQGEDGGQHRALGEAGAAKASGRSSSSSNSSHIEIQSWQFVVATTPVKSKYLPTGMHYCKLLSPARAMEWIYLDSLRARLSLRASS